MATAYAAPISVAMLSPSQVRAEVAGDETRQDVQRCAAFTRRADHFAHVRRFGRREHLDELRDDRARERAAGDHGGELPPQRAVAEVRDQEVRDE